jgi:tripartite-type tricarboxylate transporter receptor subunit TctC
MKLLGRKFILGVMLLPLALWASGAAAQSWPSKPIKWVVPFAPGGLADNVSRAAAQRLSERLGQPVIVENRAGANGGIGAAYVAKAAPDGYTILTGSTGTHAINPHLYGNLPYDALKDFAPISGLADYELCLVVPASSPNRTLAALLAQAKTKPGGLSYGSSGPGSSNHMVSEMLGVLSNTKFVHIPYKGDGPALIDLMGGQLDFMFTPISSGLQYEKVNRVRIIATTGAKRSPGTPNAPVAIDTVPGMEFAGWNGVFAPAGTPREIVARISQELILVLGRPDMKVVFDGLDNAASTPEAFAARLKRDFVLWEEVVRKSGAKAN